MQEKEIKSENFEHSGKNYVIKVFQVGNKYIVRSFLNGMAANICSYSVELDCLVTDNWEYNFGSQLPYEPLIRFAKEDIKNGNGIKRNI